MISFLQVSTHPSTAGADVLAARVRDCLDDALLVGVVPEPGPVAAAAAVGRLQHVPPLPEEVVRVVSALRTE